MHGQRNIRTIRTKTKRRAGRGAHQEERNASKKLDRTARGTRRKNPLRRRTRAALFAAHRSCEESQRVISVDHDLTLAQAKAADALIAKGEAGVLTGLPIAHKDVFVTRGWTSTAGSKMLANYTSPFDATVVER